MKVQMREDYDDRSTPVVAPNTVDESVSPEDEVPYSETNNAYMNISDDLPSRFVFYPYNTLSIKTFDVGAIRKIFRAVTLQKLQPIVEVISSSIDPGKRATDLTVQDFWALMFWERINSYKKTTYNLTLNCTDADHLEKVRTCEVSKDTLKSEHIFKSVNDFRVKMLDADKVVEFVTRVKETYGIGLYPTTIGDNLEMEALIEDTKNEDDRADIVWFSRLASNINRAHGKTVKDRMAFLSTVESPDFLEEVEQFIELCNHGIEEVVKLPCKHCGVMQEVEVSFDALSFFPRYK